MKSMSAAEAKNGFGLLIDTARQEPVKIEKHDRPVVVMMGLTAAPRLTLPDTTAGPDPSPSQHRGPMPIVRNAGAPPAAAWDMGSRAPIFLCSVRDPAPAGLPALIFIM
ncbi:type II toxin-antitoxin system Phd/YefM family antitoxin [Aquamicrobium sp. LC103]|uniref:type II toxin-antitoxin system Phd/YefM family antitoxin n=1 Tax=Aquamicrobium sp. LC103 TaxID=1120658 RepID=UPI0006997644|nr:type II toxin-antitoxin system Phd/YefM family antitoxin [Aquamicrobium sp. LC103]